MASSQGAAEHKDAHLDFFGTNEVLLMHDASASDSASDSSDSELEPGAEVRKVFLLFKCAQIFVRFCHCAVGGVLCKGLYGFLFRCSFMLRRGKEMQP